MFFKHIIMRGGVQHLSLPTTEETAGKFTYSASAGHVLGAVDSSSGQDHFCSMAAE